MYAENLIGKYAIRTGPTRCGDRSYSDNPIKILSANRCKILYQHTGIEGNKNMYGNKAYTLYSDFCDDQWQEVCKESKRSFSWLSPCKELVKVSIGCKTFEVSKEKAKALIDLLE